MGKIYCKRLLDAASVKVGYEDDGKLLSAVSSRSQQRFAHRIAKLQFGLRAAFARCC